MHEIGHFGIYDTCTCIKKALFYCSTMRQEKSAMLNWNQVGWEIWTLILSKVLFHHGPRRRLLYCGDLKCCHLNIANGCGVCMLDHPLKAVKAAEEGRRGWGEADMIFVKTFT